MNFLVLIACFFLTISGVYAADARTEIIMWHAMAGPYGKEINLLATKFNKSQSEYVLKPIYKGSYFETLTSYTAAFRAHQAPAIVQVPEVSRASMIFPPGVIKPVGKLLSQQKIIWQEERMWPALRAYYAKDGILQALPFNVSLPVMYYNKEALATLGETTFPKTWQEFNTLLTKIKFANYACAYTTAYPSWIHLEAFYALHGLAPNIQQNLLLQHLRRLKSWHKKHKFEYAGRVDEATSLFTSGKCILFSHSSASYRSLVDNADFTVGVAPLPIDKNSKRYANVVGGAALWVTSDLNAKVEKGIAQFFAMFLKPETQRLWYERTGYLPIVSVERDPTYSSQQSMIINMITHEWSGIKSADYLDARAQHRIRNMNDELLESLLVGNLSAEDMVIKLLKSRDYAYMRFIKNHGLIG